MRGRGVPGGLGLYMQASKNSGGWPFDPTYRQRICARASLMADEWRGDTRHLYCPSEQRNASDRQSSHGLVCRARLSGKLCFRRRNSWGLVMLDGPQMLYTAGAADLAIRGRAHISSARRWRARGTHQRIRAFCGCLAAHTGGVLARTKDRGRHKRRVARGDDMASTTLRLACERHVDGP